MRKFTFSLRRKSINFLITYLIFNKYRVFVSARKTVLVNPLKVNIDSDAMQTNKQINFVCFLYRSLDFSQVSNWIFVTS